MKLSLVLSWLSALVATATTVLAEASPPVRRVPEAGVPSEAELGGGGVHLYRLELGAGRRWRLAVEQLGVDVTVAVRGPQGEVAGPVDSPLDRRGSEHLAFRSREAGGYTIEVRSREPAAPEGRYRLRLEELGYSSAEEFQRFAAETARGAAGEAYAADRRREALRGYQESFRRWRQVGDGEDAARELYCVAVLQRLVGEVAEALETAEESLRRWRALERPYWEAAALNELGLGHWRLDALTPAREHFHRALDLRRALGDVLGAVKTRNNVCLTHLAEGSLRRGLACYQPVFGELEGLPEPQLRATVLLNVAWTFDRLGEPDEALERTRQALALMRRAGDRKGEAQTLNNLGKLEEGLDLPEEALESYLSALEILEELDDPVWQGTVLHNLGHLYGGLAQPRPALAFLGRALELRRRVGNRSGEVATLNELGRIRLGEGEPEGALAHFQQARELARELDRPLAEAAALTRSAGARLALDAPARALEEAEAALHLFQRAGDRRGEAEAHHLLGVTRLRLGEPSKAAERLALALRLRRAVRDGAGEVATLTALAHCHRARGDLGQAGASLEAALERIEVLRVRLAGDQLRATAQGSRREAYELYAEVLMELSALDPGGGYEQRALEVSEGARARSFLDLVHRAGAGQRSGTDPELLRRRGALVRRLEAKVRRRTLLLSRGAGEEGGDEGLAAAELEVASARRELDRLEAEIERSRPRASALTSSRPLPAHEVQGLLDGETVLLEVLLGEERSFLWWVTRQAIAAFELPPRAEIEDLARRVHSDMTDPEPGKRHSEARAAERLSSLLLGPVAHLLEDQRLAIVADGALGYLPFAALPRPSPGEPPGPGRAEPLLARHEIIYLPSASVLETLRQEVARPGAPAASVAVVADPVFGAEDPRLPAGGTPPDPAAPPTPRVLSPSRIAAPDVPRLPGSRREALAIASLVAPPGRARLALDFDASREVVLAGGLDGYRVVHFATHGLIDSRMPHLSGLMLSRYGADGRPRDGFLRLHEIFGLRLGADLVVLSGCSTALGKEVRGEGFLGLIRGFFHAGAPRVVASLWRVDDRSTAELMSRFYRGMLLEGRSPPAALRAAQLSIRGERRWRDPYYWAPFVLVGDWRP